MHTRRRLLCLVPIAALLPTARAQVRVEGYTFGREASVGGQVLQLNGVGLRAVAWLKGYAAGLYLGRKATTPAAVLADTGAKRLQLRMLQEVPAEEFTKAVGKGIARNTPPADQPALQERMRQFEALVLGLKKVRKGDLVDLDWVPGQGLVFAYNGRALAAPLPGADFYAALLLIFIGPHPVDRELKAGLLGGPVA
jgi:hypothetical protein